jgi:NADPH:quinone reductase-like Zn-dependent oxidoreductase
LLLQNSRQYVFRGRIRVPDGDGNFIDCTQCVSCLGIPKPTGSVIPQKAGLLIWGASSSVGTSALRLARNIGFKVFATASPTHHQTLKFLGAFEVFDYHDSSAETRSLQQPSLLVRQLLWDLMLLAKGNQPSKLLVSLLVPVARVRNWH